MSSPAKRQTRWVDVLGAIIIAAGTALTVVRMLGEDPIARNPESFLGSVALGALIATPGVLCLLANRTGRSSLLLSGGMVLGLLSTMSPATLPLLVAAVALVLRWARCGPSSSRLRALAANVVVVVGVLAATALFLTRTTTRTFTSPDHTYSTSGWVTVSTALLVLVVLVGTVAAAYALAPGSRASTNQSPQAVATDLADRTSRDS